MDIELSINKIAMVLKMTTYINSCHCWIGRESRYSLVEIIQVKMNRCGKESASHQVQSAGNTIENDLN